MSTINLSIVSTVTLVKSVGSIVSPDPQSQTARDLNGVDIPVLPVEIRALEVGSQDVYRFETRTTSESRTILLRNVGNKDLTIFGVDFSENNVNPVLNSLGNNLRNGNAVTIRPDSQYEFGLAYYSVIPGQHNNFFVVRSDDNTNSSEFRVSTVQQVSKNQNEFFLDPNTITGNIVDFGGTTSTKFTLNVIDQQDRLANSIALFQNLSPGFTIDKISNSEFNLSFDADRVSNVNSIYTSTVLVVANIERSPDFATTSTKVLTIPVSVNVDIDYTQYQHYADWISAGSHNNSIIGVSYDKIQGQKYITIGIGAGGDNTPEYAAGGAAFLLVSALGVAYSVFDTEYANWNQVYRIPVDDSAAIYYSKNHLVKLTDVDYGSYFGEFALEGSMFIVENDGYDNFKITLNKLRAISGNENTDITLRNLSKAFYYYSETDAGNGRITQLGSPKGDGFQTDLFTGFDSQGSVTTELVYYELNL